MTNVIVWVILTVTFTIMSMLLVNCRLRQIKKKKYKQYKFDSTAYLKSFIDNLDCKTQKNENACTFEDLMVGIRYRNLSEKIAIEKERIRKEDEDYYNLKKEKE